MRADKDDMNREDAINTRSEINNVQTAVSDERKVTSPDSPVHLPELKEEATSLIYFTKKRAGETD